MTASTTTLHAIAVPGGQRLAFPGVSGATGAHETDRAEALHDASGAREDAMMRATSSGVMRVVTLLLEVLLGFGLLCLFLLALAWDPIDRRMGTRGKRIAARLADRSPAGETRDSGGAYAILPAE